MSRPWLVDLIRQEIMWLWNIKRHRTWCAQFQGGTASFMLHHGPCRKQLCGFRAGLWPLPVCRCGAPRGTPQCFQLRPVEWCFSNLHSEDGYPVSLFKRRLQVPSCRDVNPGGVCPCVFAGYLLHAAASKACLVTVCWTIWKALHIPELSTGIIEPHMQGMVLKGYVDTFGAQKWKEKKKERERQEIASTWKQRCFQCSCSFLSLHHPDVGVEGVWLKLLFLRYTKMSVRDRVPEAYDWPAESLPLCCLSVLGPENSKFPSSCSN